jgi:hypothetical protein
MRYRIVENYGCFSWFNFLGRDSVHSAVLDAFTRLLPLHG